MKQRKVAVSSGRLPLIFLFVVLFVPRLCFAKREQPAPVTPVTADGIIWNAPNDSGHFGYLQAADGKTGQVLSRAIVYRMPIDPAIEQDVQWVFIVSLERDGAGLRITAEDGSVFHLDFKTRHVTLLKHGTRGLLLPLGSE